MQLSVSMHKTGEVSMFYQSCALFFSLSVAIIIKDKYKIFRIVYIIVCHELTANNLYAKGRTRTVHSTKTIQICQIIVGKIEILLFGMQEMGLNKRYIPGLRNLEHAALWDIPKSLVRNVQELKRYDCFLSNVL